MEVRRIRPQDGLLFRTLRLRALEDAPTAFATTLAQGLAFPEQAWHDRAADNAVSDTIAMFFAEYEGHVVGMAGGFLETGDPTPSLISMWVAPEVRGRGAGEALIDAVTVWAWERGAGRLQLWVTETNAPAIALYRRAEFLERPERQPLPSDPTLNEQRMERDI